MPRPTKRPRPLSEEMLPSSSTPAPSTHAISFTSQLLPVRLCLLPFVSGEEAVRLLSTCRSALGLLHGYAIIDHIFTYESCTVAQIKRSFAFYSRRHIRICDVILPANWSRPLHVNTGRSLLPVSLVVLTLGADEPGTEKSLERPSDPDAVWDSGAGWDTRPAVAQRVVGSESAADLTDFYERVWPVEESLKQDMSWSVLPFRSRIGSFDRPIPAGALPRGLRFLQLNDLFNQPLDTGSIPNTVEIIQFGQHFDQPLAVGHLPASLTSLILDGDFNQPLLPNVLPPNLRRLRLSECFNQPLYRDTFPPRLQQLEFTWQRSQPVRPGVIPPSVTHLGLNLFWDEPLQVGSITHGVVHLHLSCCLLQPLLPGVLPRSLRELVLQHGSEPALQPGSLPEGLEVLSFRSDEEPDTLRPGILPASLVVLSGHWLEPAQLAGAVPGTVRWLRLRRETAEKLPSGFFAPTTRVVWWKEEEVEDEEDED